MSTHPLDRGATAARWQRLLSWALLVGTVCALTAGVIAWLLGAPGLAGMCWAAGTLSAVIPALWWVGKALAHRRVGVDIVAVLSLLGALAVGEYLAGALIAVMLATGRTLEAAAQRICGYSSPARRRPRDGATPTAFRRFPSKNCSPVIGWWSAPARSFRWTGCCFPSRPPSTSRR